MVNQGATRSRRPLALVLWVGTAMACSHASHIMTEPPRATVYVNGAFIGETPAVYHSERGLPRRYHVEIYRKGFEPLDLYVDARLSIVWGIFGSILFVPNLWAWSLESDYTFYLTPTAETAAAWEAEERARRKERERRRREGRRQRPRDDYYDDYDDYYDE